MSGAPDPRGAAAPAPASAPEAMLAGILAIAADAIITVDEAQRILHFNQGAEQIFGWRAEEIVGQPLDLLLPERFRAAHAAHVAAFGAGRETARRMGHRREIFGLRRDGEEFPAEASIAKLALPDGRTVYSAVLRDITDRKRAEEEQRFLAAASAVLAASLDYAATAAAIPPLAVPRLGDWCVLEAVDPDGTLRRETAPPRDPARAAALEELARRHPFDPDSPWPAVDVLRTGRPELVATVDDDWLEAHAVDAEHRRLLHAAGLGSLLIVPLVARERVIGALTCARGERGQPFDAADLALASDLALRAALGLENARLYATAQRATRARDVVLGVVSHDLRNPLAAIGLHARALRERAAATADRERMVSAICESAEWMQRLIQDLLDVAAVEAGRLSLERRPADVGAIVARALGTFEGEAAERGLVLRGEVAPTLPAAHGDAERILQVLANLIGNAVKFTEPGGEVVVRAVPHDDGILLSVSDSGAGIPTEHLPHLFELYWHARHTARRRGSGYGLAIARGIVEAHGGRIWVESVLGAGSTFHFTLPAHAGGAAG
ncbi:MAG TPA: ATP-binding protein [Gemmatimonadaceae bacterium]|nr:ATP-binding protein [Gemmatimonadaceae bacterium]